jgi:hypothetical protein
MWRGKANSNHLSTNPEYLFEGGPLEDPDVGGTFIFKPKIYEYVMTKLTGY